MVFLWDFHWIPVGFLWYVDDVSMWFLLDFYVVSIGFLCGFYWIPV